MKEISGQLDAQGLRFGFVVGRFNSMVTERLLQAGLEIFERHGGSRDKVTVMHVPGSFEIPVAAQKMARTGEFDAIVCLGCLIRGETSHYDHLATEVTRGIDQVALEHGIPVTYGVITAETVEQALNRAGIKYGNKGIDATVAAIEMARAFEQLRSE